MERIITCNQCRKEIIKGKTGFARYSDETYDCGPCVRKMYPKAIKLEKTTDLKAESAGAKLETKVKMPSFDN